MLAAGTRGAAGRVTAGIPYYAYGRADKKDQPHISITARLLANFIEVAGADRVLTVDLHAGQIQGFFNIPVDELHAMPLIVEHFRSLNLERPVVVAPDVGRAKDARNFAAALGGELATVEKRRSGNDERAEALTIIGPDVRDRATIIYDDEILTGRTVLGALARLRARGGRAASVCSVAPALRGPAFSRPPPAEGTHTGGAGWAGTGRAGGMETARQGAGEPGLADVLGHDRLASLL